MSPLVNFELDLPDELEGLRLPEGVDARLQELLDRQDRGERLSAAERREAEGLVSLAEMHSLLRLRAERAISNLGLSVSGDVGVALRTLVISRARGHCEYCEPEEETSNFSKSWRSQNDFNFARTSPARKPLFGSE